MSILIKSKVLLYVSLALLYTIIIVMIKPHEPAVFLLWLFSIVFMVLRLRFGWMDRLILIDIIVFLITSVFYPEAYLLAIPSLMLLLYQGRLFSIFLQLIVWVGFSFLRLDTLLLIFLSTLSGLMLYGWRSDKKESLQMIDFWREKVYHSETELELLTQDRHELSRLSALSERNRIAQKLHDDLGHELTGALLALRAYETKHVSSKDEASFKSLKSRLEKSVESLKETIQHTKTEEAYGYEAFMQRINKLNISPVDFDQQGNIELITAYHWQCINSVLKEAITNIYKHSQPKIIKILLQVEKKVIRLSIANNGLHSHQSRKGFGLRFMRKRIEAIGGVLTIQKTTFFTLIVILPLSSIKEA